MNNILLILSAIGFTLIIKNSFLLSFPRAYIKAKASIINKTLGIYVEKLFSCSQCLGFWCGFILFLLYNLPELSYSCLIYNSILFGFISSVLSNITDMFMTFIDEKTFYIQQKNESKTKKD